MAQGLVLFSVFRTVHAVRLADGKPGWSHRIGGEVRGGPHTAYSELVDDFCVYAAGDVVRAAVRDREAALFLKTMGEVGQVVPVACDVTYRAHCEAAVAGAERVVNLVGILYESGKSSFRAIHVEGAGNVARAAAEAGAARLVHLSAIGADRHAPSEYGRATAAAVCETASVESIRQSSAGAGERNSCRKVRSV